MHNNITKIYRLDIQGLRAIAVLLVFFSHVGDSIFAGGFIGVDVFFVISGYVITQLILVENYKTGKFNFLRFYAKRLKRLMPALLLMILCTLVALYWLLPLYIFESQIDSSLSATAWVSNIYFLFQNNNYFSNLDGSGNFFLHTWSLGIEEQFYLVWPLLLVFLFFLKKPKNGLYLGLITITALSLILHFSLSSYSDLYSFYLMPTRFWQFSLGGIAAYLQLNQNNKQTNTHKLNGFLYGIGLALIIFAAVYLNSGYRYPYVYVLIPSIGSFLLLISYENKGIWLQDLLSKGPMVWLGNLSYSLYLWHWPVILFIEQYDLGSGWVQILFAFSCTLLISTLAYYLVENPIRKLKPNKTYIEQISALVSVIVIACCILFFIRPTVDTIEMSTENSIYKSASELPSIYKYGCDTWFQSSELQPCQFGDKDSTKAVVLFGDSILAQWYPIVAQKYLQKDWKLLVITKSACPIVDEPFYYERIKSNYKVCEIWRNKAINFIKELKPDVLIMGNAVLYPFDENQWKSGTRRIINSLENPDMTIKLIAGTPELGFSGPQCLIQQEKTNKKCETDMSTSKSWHWLSSITEEFPQVTFVELSQYVCPNQICRAKMDEQIVFRDDKHLTNLFVISLYDEIKNQF